MTMLAPLALVIIPLSPGGIAGPSLGAPGAGRPTSAAANSDPPTIPATSAPVTVATLLISASSWRWLASHPTRAFRSFRGEPRHQGWRCAHLQDRPGGECRSTLGGVVIGLPVRVGRCRGKATLPGPSAQGGAG